jgi:hypothetical protein
VHAIILISGLTSHYIIQLLGYFVDRIYPIELEIKDTTEPQTLEYGINGEIYTPYGDAAGLLIHINGKFTMGKLKPSVSFLTTPHCQLRGVGQGMNQTYQSFMVATMTWLTTMEYLCHK